MCIVLGGVGLTGGATALLTSATTHEIANEPAVTEEFQQNEVIGVTPQTALAPQQIEVMAIDMNTNEVIAEYPSVFDASVLRNIPEDAVLNSIMVSEGIEGILFVYK